MNAERWEEIQVSFDALVELDSPHRIARLAMLASSDPELHRALESLLDADAAASAQLAPIDAASERAGLTEAEIDVIVERGRNEYWQERQKKATDERRS